MKYTFAITGLILTQFLVLNNAVGQYTKGGSEKNYDRFKVSYDSIVTEKKIPIQGVNSGYVGFTFSYLKTTDVLSKSQMTQSEYIASPGFGAPISSGKIGLKNGFNFGLNFQSPLKGINKNLIPQIDIGLNTKFCGSMVKYDWKQMYTDQSAIFYEIFNVAHYKPITIISAGTGPSITYIHNPKKPIFFVDGYLRFNINAVLGGGLESSYTSASYSKYDLSITRDQACISFSPTIGLNFRIGAFMIFVEKNFSIIDQTKNNDKSFSESYKIDYGASGSYSGQVFNSNLIKYSNIQFGFGLVF